MLILTKEQLKALIYHNIPNKRFSDLSTTYDLFVLHNFVPYFQTVIRIFEVFIINIIYYIQGWMFSISKKTPFSVKIWD